MRKSLPIAGALAIGALGLLMTIDGRKVEAAASKPVYTADGKLVLPKNYRSWVYIGAPLTPNGLNSGKAGFPEFHNVYIEKENLEAYRKDQILEVLVGVALKTMSNYADHISPTELDQAFQAERQDNVS